MAKWQQILAGMTTNVERRFDSMKERLGAVLGSDDPIMIAAYHGYGTPQTLRLRGRVLEDKGIEEATENDRLWDNLLNMYRRLESDEIPFARVRIHFQGQAVDAVADDEGFFTTQLEPLSPLRAGELWYQVELELLEPAREDHPPVHTTGLVLVPPAAAQFGVISDIDDTVVHSHATSLLRMARLVFLGNARTRLPFPASRASTRPYRAAAAVPRKTRSSTSPAARGTSTTCCLNSSACMRSPSDPSSCAIGASRLPNCCPPSTATTSLASCAIS